MSRFMNEKYAGVAPYVPGEQPQDMKYVKLNTNESPFPPAPQVLAALSVTELERLRLYPDPEGMTLRQKLAHRYRVRPENIFLANGSDDILNFAFMAFAGGRRPAYFPDISYGFYPVFAGLHGVSYTPVPLKDDFTLDYRDYCGRDGLIVIANPNAPTGLAVSVAEIEQIVGSNPHQVVVIDEAYVDFGAASCSALTGKYDNLLVVMTFSKSRSLAGARLGFAIGDPGLINDLNRLKYATNPYNVNLLTLLCGEAALDADAYYGARCAEIVRNRDDTARELQRLGFQVLPSMANFLFAAHPALAGEVLYGELKRRGVLVRHFSQPRIRQYNRITIGTREEMDLFLAATQNIMEGSGSK